MRRARSIVVVTAMLTPLASFAQPDLGYLIALLAAAQNILQALIPIFITVALLVFFWGLIKYILATDDESKAAARGIIVYGIIILTVMVAVWGIVNLIIDIFQLDLTPPPIPAV